MSNKNARVTRLWSHDHNKNARVTRLWSHDHIKMLELLGFGHMTTSSIWFETRGKILLMTSWVEPLRGHKRFFKILLF